MMLQLRSVRRDLSVSIGTDSHPLEALLLPDGSPEMFGVASLLTSQDRLTSLFGEILEKELLPSAAKRPAKQEDDDEDEDDDDKADDDDADEDEDEEETEEEEDEDEEDDDDEEEEDEFEDADSGFDDDDDDDEEDFDDDE